MACRYFTGVAAALQSLGIVNNTTRLAGSSGGAITAAALCSDIPAADLLATCLNITTTCRDSMGCRGTLDSVIRPAFQRAISAAANRTHLPIHNGITDWCRNRLTVSLTHARAGNLTDLPLLASHFENEAQLVDALAGSSFLPFLSAPSAVTQYEGLAVYDGQLSDALPCPSGDMSWERQQNNSAAAMQATSRHGTCACTGHWLGPAGSAGSASSW